MKIYAIIDFQSGSELETAIVPTLWLNLADRTCHWPDRPVNSRAVIDCIRPERSWSIFPFVGIKYESDDYRKAVEKMKQLINGLSDIASTSENEESLHQRRRLAQRKRTWSSSESDGEILSATTTERHSEELQLPKISFVCKTRQLPVQGAVSNAASRTSQEPAAPVRENDSIDRTHQRLFKMLEEIKAGQQQLQETMNQLLLRQNVNENLGEAASEDFSCPLMTEADLQKMEDNLEDRQMRKMMMKYLSCIGGGENVATLVPSMLRRIFSTPLALQYNFTGVKGKKGFIALRIRGVMMDAVRSVFPNGTELEINNVARKWFISARDRDGGRHRRFNSTTDSSSPSRRWCIS